MERKDVRKEEIEREGEEREINRKKERKKR